MSVVRDRPAWRAIPAYPRSLSALAALVFVGVLLVGIEWSVQRRLPEAMAVFAERPSPVKLTGNILQIAAFRSDGILPIYGSSELDRAAANRPDAFFRDRPTGFAAFPVGRGGTTCLMILQKVAAVGPAARGKKAVIILSPSWFARDEAGENAVDANLTSPQLSAWSFGHVLSRQLRQKVARRLLDYPESLQDEALLADAVSCMAEPSFFRRAVFAFLTPLGWMQNAIFQRLEYCAILREMILQRKRPAERTPTRPGVPDWAKLAADAEARDRAHDDGAVYSATNAILPKDRRAENIRAQRPGSRDAEFATKVSASKEYDDLRLLIEVLQEMGVDALFISQPFNGRYRDLGGTTRKSRQVYYEKLANTMTTGPYVLRDFNDQEEDRFFFNDANHPSAKAWIFYDHAIDDFYHRNHP